MAKISTFIIALTLVSLFMGVFALFNANLNETYSPPTGNITTSDLETYNLLTNISSQTSALESNVTRIREQQNALDVIGGYFSSAYQALVITKDSFTLFSHMLNTGIDDANLGASATLFRATATIIVLIIIIIGVLLSAITKYDL